MPGEFAAQGTAPDRLIERYAVLGGTPQYQVWAGTHSVERIIKEVTRGHDDAPRYADWR